MKGFHRYSRSRVTFQSSRACTKKLSREMSTRPSERPGLLGGFFGPQAVLDDPFHKKGVTMATTGSFIFIRGS